MEVITFFRQAHAIRLVELVHERIIAQFIKPFLPPVADELPYVGSFEERKVCLDRDTALRMCLSGPPLRATGIPYDVRRDTLRAGGDDLLHRRARQADQRTTNRVVTCAATCPPRSSPRSRDSRSARSGRK